jgi:outer membrane protein assembly factor BamB
VGRASLLSYSASSTIAPLWVPANPPFVLGASSRGDLVAFAANDPSGSWLWEFHPAGPIYGMPAYDPVQHRIYFGAVDKRLYALDEHGIFLWSFATGDVVASRPAVVGDEVIFGSEDRTVYGLDAATGAERWEQVIGGAVVSWPVVVGNLAAIGSDDSRVFGLDPTNGEIKWTYEGDDALVAAGSDGAVYLLDERGKRVRSWNTNAATTPVDGPSGGVGTNFHIGGTSGGESVWLADNNAVVYRLGPSDPTVPALLPLAWLDDRSHRVSPLNPLASFYLPVADSRVRLSSSTAVTRSPCSTRPPVPARRPGVSPAANRSPRSSRLSPGRRS